mmetsp:Transcript_19353/g.37961  ORF Transcript_19353/g.37961 Transcript_19353/m.37961 type:complete len:356 (-) Transcript_19353:115-1182(-)
MGRRRVVVFGAPPSLEDREETCRGDGRMFKLRRPGLATETMAVIRRGKTLYEVQEVAPMRPASWMVDQSTISDGSLLICTPLDVAFVLLPLLLQAPKETSQSISQLLEHGKLPAYKELGEDPLKSQVKIALGKICEVHIEDTSGEELYKFCEKKCRVWFKAKAERTRDALCSRELAKMEQTCVKANIVDAKGATAVDGFQFGTKRNAGSAREAPEEAESASTTITPALALSSKKRASFLLQALEILSDYVPPSLHSTLRSDIELEISTDIDEVEAEKYSRMDEETESKTSNQSPSQADAENPTPTKKSKSEEESKTPVVPLAIRRLEKVDKRGMSKLSTFFTVKKSPVSKSTEKK